ncbi:MAG: sulfatase-like hydrolase/transferase [Clostridia bacterium]|nr:sulfatase-like hydrolase/transferase [Clostridia bacterium]
MKPNVLFIVCDQLRYDSVGFAGIEPVKTPNIDRLAEEGLFFENAYTPFPVCAPSRQSMLTGVQPESIGILCNYNFFRGNGADPKIPTWVSELKDAGYRCGFAGHWDASPHGSENDFGYETIFSNGDWGREIGEKYGAINYPNSWFGCSNPIAFEDTKTCRICDSVSGFIRESAGQPWHAWLDLVDPHLPCRPSAPYDTMYSPEDMTPWPGFGDTLEGKPYIQKKQIENWHLENYEWKDFAPTKAYYFGLITQTDAAIGRVLDTLRETGQYDNTLIILLADHGDTSGDHGMMDKHYILYDSVVHVPFIVRHPSLGSGRVKSFACSSLDVAPTVEKIVGLTAESTRHGRAVTDYIDGSETPDFAVFSSNGQQFGLFTQRGIRTEKYKYIWNLTDTDEFYDLTLDPGEKVNRASDPAYREIIAHLGEKLYAELVRRGDPFANGWVKWQCGRGI